MNRLALCLCAIFCIFLFGCNGSTSTNNQTSISVNTPLISPGSTTQIIITNTSTSNSIVNPSISLKPWLNTLAQNKNLSYSGTIGVGESHVFSFSLDSSDLTVLTIRNKYQDILTNPASQILQIITSSLASPLNPELDVNVSPDPEYLPLTKDIIINADLWSDKPEIMSAGYGFEGIEGVPEGESQVIAAGGAWEIVTTSNPPYRALTSAATPEDISIGWGYPVHFTDAIPVVFSWPVLPSTIDHKDFQVMLNTGDVVTPFVASISPNLEFNERSTVVIFGEFGNRLAPGTPGAVYPISVSIVSKLKLVGPNGPVTAVGLTKDSSNPYLPQSGPTLVAAKLSVMSVLGEGVGQNNAFSGDYPNDGVAYYGESNAQYRLRIYTSGGFSQDGVAAMLPTDFKKFFRLQVTNTDGSITWLTDTGIVYNFPQGNIEIIGLADLGLAGAALNDAYLSDSDNYIDIVLKGDRAAMKLITAVDIPAADGYLPFYNPGGPGNNPTPGVIYTTPGAPLLQLVTQALDDPKTVTYVAATPNP